MNQIKHYISMLAGTFIIALSFTLLQGPNQIASGGLTGASLVLSSIFNAPSAIILWVTTLFLLVVCCYFLGVHSILKSVIGSLLIPFFVYLTNDLPPLTNDPLLASICGGLGVGAGLGLVFRAGGNTGGFTLIAQSLHKIKAAKHSTSIMYMDAAVMIAGGLIFSPEKALYALAGAFVTRKTMDIIQGKNTRSNIVYVISSENYEKRIANWVLYKLGRGLTKVSGAGGYSGNERVIMMIVLEQSKVKDLRSSVQEIDPHAFIILCEATEVFGEGFTPFFPVPEGKKAVTSSPALNIHH
ncbi:YitT family protein [Domibacillus sp. PGB-M46]|uniref:YitT family protein n=1 Tax=Domibacillus sp. PGB-M46 TaxID=2910255 RepID=UPI001F59FB50|nr:YitT family protein [Domibacillus sp. PGB-M46]MCI2255615.1 YitT family protein [Domibacillus sp. PGB-M46]